MVFILSIDQLLGMVLQKIQNNNIQVGMMEQVDMRDFGIKNPHILNYNQSKIH